MTTADQIEDLIRRLRTWRDRRQAIAQRPHRTGKPLPNTELGEAIHYLMILANLQSEIVGYIGRFDEAGMDDAREAFKYLAGCIEEAP